MTKFKKFMATIWILSVWLCLCVTWSSATRADTTEDDPQPAAQVVAVTVELIQNRVQAVQDAKDLDDTTRTAILDLYKQANAELELEKQWQAQAADFEKRIAVIPQRMEKVETDLAALPDKPSIAVPADATLGQLEKMVQQQDAEVGEAKKTLAELEGEPKRRADRRVEIPKLATAARERLAEIEKEIAVAPPSGEVALLTAARRTLLDVRKLAAQAEMAAIQKELAFYDASVDLLPLRRDLVKRHARILQQQAKAGQAAVAERRKNEVAQQSQRAELILEQVPDALQPLAKENVSLAKRRKAIEEQLEKTRHKLANAKKQLESLQEQFNRVQAQEEAIGLNGTLGMLLRKHRDALPDGRELRRESKEHRQQIGDLQAALLELQEQRSEMADVDEQVELALTRNVTAEEATAEKTEQLARQLVTARREYLDGLLVDNNACFETLVSLDTAQQELTKLVEQYTDYIDERVLWIRSTNTVHIDQLPAAAEAGLWLLSPKRWSAVGNGLMSDAASHPLLAVLAVAIFLPLLVFRLKFRKIIGKAGREADCVACETYMPTLRALGCVTLFAVLWPAVLAYLAWRLAGLPGTIQLAQPLSASLIAAAGIFLPLELWRQVSRPRGLAHAHFGCSEVSLRAVRRHLRWLIPLTVPLAGLVTLYRALENERWENSLGRGLFLALLCLVAFFVQRVLSPRGSVMREVIATYNGGWLDRLKMIWYPLAVLTPLSLAALACAGYYYTAGQLAVRLHTTIFLILSILLGSGLLLRWVFINQRRIAAEQARVRIREAVEAAGAENNGDGLASELSATIPAEGELIDLQKIDLQTRRLVRSFALLAGIFGTWLIWNDVIPALGMLERVPLWDTVVQVTKTVTLADGTTRLESIPSVQVITLAHLMSSLLIVLMMFVAIKNIPGLLEVAILRRLPLDAALRFAFTTVTRYALIIVGMVWALSTIGWGWAKIQWLIAAVSVGLGFGLQEIFANFVSGLILLFERPLRSGDVVTVGDVSGKVVQIRTRATVIQDWDRKELIIPNKEFITGRLLNWTLTDPVNRVVIQVGVAYGSDTTRTREIMLGAAVDHPLIMTDPAPSVTFDLFGDSSLNFTLRAFLPNLDNRLAVIHDLHATINERLAAAGIEIAFPQRDLHLRSMEVPLSMFQNEKSPVAVESMSRKSA